jgi:hypothetical protein
MAARTTRIFAIFFWASRCFSAEIRVVRVAINPTAHKVNQPTIQVRKASSAHPGTPPAASLAPRSASR